MEKAEQELEKHTHCRHCGEELFSFEAEAWLVKTTSIAGMGDIDTYRLDSKYDQHGNRNYCTVWQCPNYGSKPWYLKWQYDPHDIYLIYKGGKEIPSNL